MKSLKTLRLTVPMGLAALMLAITGSMSTASATTTRWVYQNVYEGNCLTYSDTTSNVWSGPCSGSTVAWYWGDSYTDYITRVTYRQLKTWYRNDERCLTTDFKTDTNAVWTSPCNGIYDSGQMWNGDNNELTVGGGLSPNYLRTSGNGDAVYSTPWGQSGIELDRWEWNGTHN
ncbi:MULTISPECIES: hypothetical protein [unclassified Streptomyces]|uniref:hypothetical protein n=1 Tax=unclassified Streptomyces TaxID=2593676 RepID=UPI0037F22FBD